MKKKLYLFGDSFSLLYSSLKEDFEDYLEINAHSSISNEHILKLTKLKLLKLINENVRDTNILIQLTLPNRMLIINSDKIKNLLTNPDTFAYCSEQISFSDKDIFEENMYCTLYPYTAEINNIVIKNLFIPYQTLIIENNYKKLIKDWKLELEILINLGKSYGINVEYFYYTNDYDRILMNYENSTHIKFEGYHSLETFLKKNFEYSYFFSKLDKHLNQNGLLWYLNFLRKRYDF